MLKTQSGTRLFLFLGLALALAGSKSAVAGLHDADDARPEADVSKETKERPIAEGDATLNKDLLEFLSKKFWIPEYVIEEEFGDKFRSALSQAVNAPTKEEKDITQNKEVPIAEIAARLMATRDENEINKLREALKEQIKKEQAEDANPDAKTDAKQRKNAANLPFLQRLEWAIQEIKGEVNEDPRATNFKAAFKVAFEKQVAENKEVKKLAQDATSSNPQTAAEAKAKLRAKNFSRASLMSYIEGKEKSGNSKEAQLMASAYPWLDKDGNPSLDFDNEGKKQRLYLSKTAPESVKDIIAFNEATRGQKARLKQFQHADTNGLEEFERKGDKIQKREAKPVAAAPGAAPAANTQVQKASAPASAAGGGLSAEEKKAITDLTSSQVCVGCHTGTKFEGTSLKDLRTAGGKKAGRSAAEILNAINNPSSPEMARMGSLKSNTSLMNALEAWKKAQSGGSI